MSSANIGEHKMLARRNAAMFLGALALALLAPSLLVLPPAGAVYNGQALGVRIRAELVGHDPNGVVAVARLELSGAALGGRGRIEGYASVSQRDGAVRAAPPLEAALRRRFVRLERLEPDGCEDGDEWCAAAVTSQVRVYVSAPFFGLIRVPLKLE